MLEKNLDRLEYNKIIDELTKHCVTTAGRDIVQKLTPYNNKFTVEQVLKETNLALTLVYRKGNIPIDEFDIDNIIVYIKNLESNNSLSAKALLEVAGILRISRLLHEYFYGNVSFDLTGYEVLADIFDMLYSNEGIENRIFNAIIDENTIADNASKVLSSLRRNRYKLEQGVRDKLTNFCHSSTYSKYLMDNIITIRNDRFVIPVKEEYKDKISGSILDISSSGSTLYIEPTSIYDLNNKISQIKAEESIEVEKILRGLSSSLFPIAGNLKTDVDTIGKLDFIFAKAKFSKSMEGICPCVNDDKFVTLVQAKHPLINPDKVVPIDITIGKDYTSLLITGPNTGGKTATLKTVGLLTAMACSGLNIPAKEGSSIYVFDSIYADIGDEQSIQESLSTFSSHMVNIIEIINDATSNSLILIDELGSGTDPVEGASLAISILEHFNSIGALTITTTHYPELKNYALVTDGFENASCDFDVEKLRPTYRLLIGVPGKSNAFAISKNLGLPNDIISRAHEFLKEDNINIETLLRNIYDDKLEIEKEKDRMTKNANQVELLRKNLERDNSKLDEEAANIILNAKTKARDILLDAKDEATEVIRELNDINTDSKQANSLRNKLNDSIQRNEDISTCNSNNKPLKALSKDDVKIGQTVLVKKFNKNGVVCSLPNKSNELQVQMGIMKMNVNLSDLAISNFVEKTEKNNKKLNSKVTFNNNLKAQDIASEINVIGLNVDEAIPIVDKYLDNAYISGINKVHIIHGKGTGKLRDGIHSFLKKNSRVKGYRMGTYGEGEMGVTIVELK